MDVCHFSDGLIDPSRIPGGELDPGRVSAAADELDRVASGVSAASDAVDVSWSVLPASFVAPDAGVVYSGLVPATDRARGMAGKFGLVAAALRDYATELGVAKSALMTVKGEAEQWLAEEVDAQGRVWILAGRTTKYQWDPQVVNWFGLTDPFGYLRGRGEVVRDAGWGQPEIKASWLESGWHVDKNNQFLDRVADAYARLNSLQVDCANRITALFDNSCVAPLESFDAEALKGSGDDAVALPWGQKVSGDRTCVESFGQGVANTGVGVLNLVGVDLHQGEWSWSWETAGGVWGGLLTTVGSLGVVINPFAWGLEALGVSSLASESGSNLIEFGKGLVSWDKWVDNPAEALGEVAVGFIPIAGWAGKGSKGAGAAAKLFDDASGVGKGLKVVDGSVVTRGLRALDDAALRGVDAGSAKLAQWGDLIAEKFKGVVGSPKLVETPDVKSPDVDGVRVVPDAGSRAPVVDPDGVVKDREAGGVPHRDEHGDSDVTAPPRANNDTEDIHIDDAPKQSIETMSSQLEGVSASINKHEHSESVNQWWSDQDYDEPPYLPGTIVQDIHLLDSHTFVRVYDGENSKLYGGWVMKPADVKGLTPVEIQNKFALPFTPKYVGEVVLPEGSNIRVGIANELFGYPGGGTQFDLKGQMIGDFKEIGKINDWVD